MVHPFIQVGNKKVGTIARPGVDVFYSNGNNFGCGSV